MHGYRQRVVSTNDSHRCVVSINGPPPSTVSVPQTPAQSPDKPVSDDFHQQNKKRKEKLVKDLLDVIILALLREQPKCGYDILGFVHKEFQVLLSPGTLYPLLYLLERNGIIKKELVGRKKVYALNGQTNYSNGLLTVHRKIFSFAEKNNGDTLQNRGALHGER